MHKIWRKMRRRTYPEVRSRASLWFGYMRPERTVKTTTTHARKNAKINTRPHGSRVSTLCAELIGSFMAKLGQNRHVMVVRFLDLILGVAVA